MRLCYSQQLSASLSEVSAVGVYGYYSKRHGMTARALMCGMDAVQNGLAEAPVNKSRKQIKERKNRTKKIRGVKKNAGMCWVQHYAA